MKNVWSRVIAAPLNIRFKAGELRQLLQRLRPAPERRAIQANQLWTTYVVLFSIQRWLIEEDEINLARNKGAH
jgi:hypothetical protein